MELFLLTPICQNSQCEYNKQGYNLENSIRTTFGNESLTIVFIVAIDHASYFNKGALHNRQQLGSSKPMGVFCLSCGTFPAISSHPTL